MRNMSNGHSANNGASGGNGANGASVAVARLFPAAVDWHAGDSAVSLVLWHQLVW